MKSLAVWISKQKDKEKVLQDEWVEWRTNSTVEARLRMKVGGERGKLGIKFKRTLSGSDKHQFFVQC